MIWGFWQLECLALSSGVGLSWTGAPGALETPSAWAINMVGLAQYCGSWQLHGETSELPRNLQICCASLFYWHFITSTLRQIHLWKKGSAGVKSLLIEKLFCYTVPDISALCWYWVAGRIQHRENAAWGRLLLVGMRSFEWLRTYILGSSNY